MKRFIVCFAAYVGIALLACEDSTLERAAVPPSIIKQYKAIGEEIPYETGMEWVDLYHEKNPQSGKTALFGQYEISDAKTLELMASVNDLVGIAFHYGKDMFGTKHIIVIPVDATLRLWTNIPGRIYVDANTGNTISQSTASEWAENYREDHPSEIWFHFFGVDTFDDIIALPFFNSVDIQPALNLFLQPQMLLIIWNESLSPGRTEAQRGAVYDASHPCPPCQVE